MYIVRKRITETPLACIRRLFGADGVKRAYAGRLDPMAEGLLLICEGEECADAVHYRLLEKTYSYSFIAGIGTDSYDRLGRIAAAADVPDDIAERVRKAVRGICGDIMLPYPPYSSKRINGRPLFELAKEDALTDLSPPERVMCIYRHELTGVREVSVADLAAESRKLIRAVRGDFRQEESIADWKRQTDRMLPLFSARMHCGGGTYVRAVVNEIGGRVGCPTMCTHITRNRIGPWDESVIYGEEMAEVDAGQIGMG